MRKSPPSPTEPEAADPPSDEKVWVTRDGRRIPFDAMGTDHMRAARRVITPWSKGERDAEKRGELRSWRKTFARELRRREKAEPEPDAETKTRQKKPVSAEFAARQAERAEQAKAQRKARSAELRDARKAARKAAPKKPFARRAAAAPLSADHWSNVLGLSPDADAEGIERAFRELAKLAHPDAGGSAAAMRHLIAARDWALSERG